MVVLSHRMVVHQAGGSEGLLDPLRTRQLGHQSSCDCRSAHKDDEELEHRGVAAIWFDGVNRHKQYGGNDADAEDVDADAEDVNDSQHSTRCDSIGRGALYRRIP